MRKIKKIKKINKMKEVEKMAATKKSNIMVFLVCVIVIYFSVSKCYAVGRVNDISHRFSFILFYMSNCPHCQRFDPILKRYSNQTHIHVLSYTLDQQSLPSFPDSVTPTQEEVRKYFPMNNVVVPTLFIADSRQHRIYPVLQGEATFNQLSQRVGQIIKAVKQTRQASIDPSQLVRHTSETQEFSYGFN